jgi:hypothetical protein
MEKILLIEGKADKAFFEALFKSDFLNMPDVKVDVRTPSEQGQASDGKSALRNYLQSAKIKELLLNDKISNLGIIVDADYPKDGQGYSKTLANLKKDIAEYGYTSDIELSQGLAFTHNNAKKLKPLGIWIMPNNQDDGMMEDWIKTIVHSSEHSLFSHAQKTVTELIQPNFKSIHQSKAEVATWMAWQDPPGVGNELLIESFNQKKKPLINSEAANFQSLINWLQYIYGNNRTEK